MEAQGQVLSEATHARQSNNIIAVTRRNSSTNTAGARQCLLTGMLQGFFLKKTP
jgi:hypothetical protein